MEEPTMDRRARYTRLALRDALAALLPTKPLARITVRELCGGADVNRATFYAHYADVFDLLGQAEQALLADIARELEPAGDCPAVLERLFGCAGRSANVFAAFLDGGGRLSSELTGLLARRLTPFVPPEPEGAALFAAAGAVALLRQWLREGCPQPASSPAALTAALVTGAEGQESEGQES